MHAYDFLEQLRYNIGEETAGHWQDKELLRNINLAYTKAAMMVQSENEDWLMKQSAALTPVDSVVTLPSDCAKPAYMEETTGEEIPLVGTVRERRVNRNPDSGLTLSYNTAYVVGDTIEINHEGFSDQIYLWYIPRMIRLHAGTPAAGGAQSLTLADGAHEPADDYYNTQEVVILTAAAGWAEDTITDYDGGTRVCTVTGTYTGATAYGTKHLLPEECEALILADATCIAMAKPGSRIRQETYQFWINERKLAKKDVEGWLTSRTAASRHVRITELI